ncbi:MAG TPA: PAS domain S-box protein [Holophaga sp.]|nr:PAS domain S-box protein [Holophaga sp.]
MARLSSLQFRLSLWVGLVVVTLNAVIIGYFAKVTQSESVEKARTHMLAMARQEARTFQRPLNRAMDVARTLAQGITARQEIGQGESRESTNVLLRRILEGNPDFLATYTLWEPNAFDGQDARYAGTPGHDRTGRFIPYWNRGQDGSIQCEAITSYETPGIGDYYLVPRQTLRETVVEPYVYPVRGRPVFMTSLVAPIIIKKRFNGIAGVDYRLDFLQHLTDQVSLYGGTGRLCILSQQGMVAGATGHPELVGQKRDPRLAIPEIPEKGQGVVEVDGTLHAFTTISLGEAAGGWTVVLSVPEKVITAEADHRILALVGGASLLALLGVAGTLLLLRRTVITRIEQLTAATEALAAGDYRAECEVSGHDELHRLGTAFNTMAAHIAASVSSLQESEALLKSAIDNALHFYALISPDGKVEYCNRTSLEVVGSSLESVVRRPFWEAPWWSHSPEEQARVRQAIADAAAGEVFRGDATCQCAGGEVRQIDFSLSPLRNARGEIIHLIAEGRDVTSEKRMSLALRASEEQYRHIVESAPLGIFRTRIGGGFEYANQGVLNQFECASFEELNQLYGEVAKRWHHVEHYWTLIDILRRKGQVHGYEMETRLANGRIKWHMLFADLAEDQTHLTGFLLDVTEQKKLREQLNQSQKMEAVGQLAGGVAHDFNNTLTAIINAAELLRQDQLSKQGWKLVDLVLLAAERAGQLTKKLLAFSRKSAKSSSPVDVAAIVNDTAAILRRTIDKRIEITVAGSAPSTWVVGDDALLQNAFMNMGINAGHAMPEGGTLVFQLEDVVLDEAYCRLSPFALEPGNYLEIAVRDTGQGMSPETLKRVFEPFFTTREQGMGTGLGLSAVYGTVQDHHGAITVYSEPEKGTVFHVYLPLASEVSLPVPAELPVERGSGTLLVIDDDELIRITAKAMLEELGYTVLTAENGRTGLEVLAARKHEIRLVVLDMIMPVMGGRDTFNRIQELDGTIPVIICSGFSKEGELSGLKRGEPAGFLHKPFRRAELAATVAEILREGSRQRSVQE